MQAANCVLVQNEGAERGGIAVKFRQSTSGQVFVMRGAKEKDSFAAEGSQLRLFDLLPEAEQDQPILQVERSVCPSSRCSRVLIARMPKEGTLALTNRS